MDSSPSVSFIGIVDFTEDAKWVYCSESVHDLLGFEPRELIGHPSLDLVHPDEFPQVRAIHYSTITQDQAAVLAYLRMRHKDPCRGYILCAISRTVCQNVLVGSVSFASPGPKALHNASTAQEITVITPTARDFEFRRWGDPSPMPPCPVPPELMLPGIPTTPPNASPMRFAPLPEQSVRTALILNRFSTNCDVQYCANDSILLTTHVLGRSFFDFVVKRDEQLVRSWIDVVKGWGVNERGQPSDGGFGYGKFSLLVEGRDSSERGSEISPVLRQRQGSRRSPPSYQHPPPKPSLPSPGSDCSRDMASNPTTGRDVIRGLTRERPIDTLLPPIQTSLTSIQPPNISGGVGMGNAPRELLVDAIFSAHSDGLVVIIRRSETNKFTPVNAPSSGTLPTSLPPSRTGNGNGNGASKTRSTGSAYWRERQESTGGGGQAGYGHGRY
ncbi:hypothetical protein BDY19DRAFT_219179 [Irpex rosettiformis]|uniref:Uncharacterized protein n=1 Tax=Irpex rosettiformis TaxID=378272 RepID=A0ACB8U0B8_9APHY|nr:hypothetical protein BDY19DRAFT_219179 [Irpex rosettiformis]